MIQVLPAFLEYHTRQGQGPNSKSKRRNDMKSLNHVWLVMLLVLPMFTASASQAQTKTQSKEKSTATSPEADAQKKNLQVYVDLLRKDIRQQKAEVMGAVMVLSAEDAAKFWPIYGEYDAELTKLNDQRVENIKEYARIYNNMTDEKADDLIQKSLAYQKQRAELLAKTYERLKQAVGAVTAARFAQVEQQLLLIIDLQIASSLPVAGQGS
jgi:hypothetical protein